MTGTWPLGWATGDVETAAEFKKGIGSISDTLLVGSAANVDITSISATYAHLLVIVYARGDTAATTTSLNMRFNGDAAANYDYQQLSASAASTAATGESFAQTAMSLVLIPANTAGANLFGAVVMFIPNYAGSTNNKMAFSAATSKRGVATTNIVNTLSGGFWRSSAAINRITLLPAAGNFVADTRVTIFGMGA